jgi:hypothetical protein
MAFLLGTGLAPFARAAGGPEVGFFGMNGVGFFHYRGEPTAEARAQERLSAVRQAGAGWDRFDFWWGEIEPKPGTWKWDRGDWLVDLYAKRNVGMLPILSYRANWMTKPPHTREDIDQFAEYTRQVVTRYKDRVRYWEVWNEPNIPTFWDPPSAADYAALLKATYAAAKRADPKCVIVGASANETDCNWLIDLYKHGAADAMDVVSFHPYSMADGPDEMHFGRQIDNLRTVMKNAGRGDVPLWITEMGWRADADDIEQVRAQSRYMVQAHVIAMAHGVQKMFWFNLRDWREKKDGKDRLEGWGLTTVEGKAKPSLAVYQRMVECLDGAVFKGYLPLDHGMAYAFRQPDGNSVLVAWARRGEQAIVPIEFSARIRDLTGQRLRRMRLPQGGPYVLVSPDPIYISGISWDRLANLIQEAPDPEDWIVNGSFEQRDGDKAYAWRKGVFYGGETDGEFIDAAMPNGDHYLGLSKTRSTLWQSFPIPALPGETFTVTAKVKTDLATGDNGVQLLFLAGPGWGWKGGPVSQTITGTADWETVTVTGTVPDDADVVRVNLVSKDNSGTVFFDDVKVSRQP